ncbi:MAG: hypothetical protein RMJ07_04265 [Nitrososphaerota archaeon]|nr:hypothetical protein [Candidatus Bathyarchaeota archaeon]MDW8048877.1 hypothetical protein [Nitrososphaerota archaeon]
MVSLVEPWEDLEEYARLRRTGAACWERFQETVKESSAAIRIWTV